MSLAFVEAWQEAGVALSASCLAAVELYDDTTLLYRDPTAPYSDTQRRAVMRSAT